MASATRNAKASAARERGRMLSAREINVDTCWRYQKARDDSFHSPFHLVTQSTDIIGACAASTRFYQVTSLVTNPTIVAALVHSMMPKGRLAVRFPIRNSNRETHSQSWKNENLAAGLCSTARSPFFLQRLFSRCTFRVIKTYSSV